MARYLEPGTYVAICRAAGRSLDQPLAHYVKVFEYPDADARERYFLAQFNLEDIWDDVEPNSDQQVILKLVDKICSEMDAVWWFSNRVDTVAQLDAVYPLHIFKHLIL